ncbi:MAG: flagellar protein FlgN [Oscillospiraceae bacterium]|nr:flagellar protein FlgN [Oscillospiraceae bacterium]
MADHSAVSYVDLELYYDKFYAYLDEFFQNYTKLSELLTRKLSAIAKFDVATLDGIIKEEQVFVLLSRGFDSNVQNYREKLSLKGSSLSEVISEMPLSQQGRFQSLLTALKSRLDEVKFLNEKCQTLIEERIYSIERSINHIDKSRTSTYSKPGTAAKPVSGGEGHVLKKSV